jgi:hypothetical protein
MAFGDILITWVPAYLGIPNGEAHLNPCDLEYFGLQLSRNAN